MRALVVWSASCCSFRTLGVTCVSTPRRSAVAMDDGAGLAIVASLLLCGKIAPRVPRVLNLWSMVLRFTGILRDLEDGMTSVGART